MPLQPLTNDGIIDILALPLSFSRSCKFLCIPQAFHMQNGLQIRLTLDSRSSGFPLIYYHFTRFSVPDPSAIPVWTKLLPREEFGPLGIYKRDHLYPSYFGGTSK